VRNKVDLYERIRRDHDQHPDWSVRRLSREHGCHRRDVRQALLSATPSPRKVREFARPVLNQWKPVIDGYLDQDRTAPRKQRHTAHRIWVRLTEEHRATVSERTVREYVARRRREVGLRTEVTVPQHHEPGQRADVDFGEAAVDFPWGREKVDIFTMRAGASGMPFHWPVRALVQQAFLEAHVEAFDFFGGVFAEVWYDNLKLAVRRVLQGRQRLETEAFTRLRSHYLFTSEFCRPGIEGAHEKGGVEGEIGYARRNGLVPVPVVSGWPELVALCRRNALAEGRRILAGHTATVAEEWEAERRLLKPLPTDPFDSARHVHGRVDPKARATVLRNRYSVPAALVGMTWTAAVSTTHVVISRDGREVACHERIYGIGGDRLVLDHYLDVLRFKPRALAGSLALHQEMERGTFPAAYQELFAGLRDRLGESEGARQMVDVLFLHREHGAPTVHMAVERAVSDRTFTFAAVALTTRQISEPPPTPLSAPRLEVLHQPAVPVPDCIQYDQLLTQGE
jgi:transposase